MGNSQAPSLEEVKNYKLKILYTGNEEMKLVSPTRYGWWINQWFNIEVLIQSDFVPKYGDNGYSKEHRKVLDVQHGHWNLNVDWVVKNFDKVHVHAKPTGIISANLRLNTSGRYFCEGDEKF